MSKICKAVVYCRVSTEDQAENGTSLETQEISCRRKAADLSAQVVSVYKDEGVSGGFLLTRPGIQAALADIETGRADMLIVYSISRLSRDVEHQQIIKKNVASVNAKLVICDMPIEDTEEGDLMFSMFGSFAQYEKKLIRKRCMGGRRRLAENGLQPSRGKHPYGYRVVTKAEAAVNKYPGVAAGKYVIVEEQARWVREMFALCAGGESVYRIARILQARGIPTPGNATEWRSTTIRHILENTTYKGVASALRFESRYDESRVADGKKSFYPVLAPPERWVLIPAPPIVDEETWQACQERIALNRRLLGGAPSRKYMLSGLLKCPLCGNMMAGRKDGKDLQYQSYKCQSHAKSSSSSGIVCNPKRYNALLLETLVTTGLVTTARQPELVAEAIAAYDQHEKAKWADSSAEEFARLEAELKAALSRERKIAEAQIDALTQGRSTDVYDKMLTEISDRKTVLNARLREIAPSKGPEHREKPLDSAAKVVKLVSSIEKVLLAEELTSAEKQKVLASIIDFAQPTEEGVLIRLRSLTNQMILVIDNYDSFTYNLVQYLGEMGAELDVRRNDAVLLSEIAALKPEKIVISPGPGTPDDAGVTLELIQEFGRTVPIFGVCLGLQAMGQAMGGRVVRADKMMHGKTSLVTHQGQGVFAGLPSPLTATRYHSLVVEPSSLPECLQVTATAEDGEIMGLRHKQWPLEAVQFHPEAILTEHGKQMLKTFLER